MKLPVNHFKHAIRDRKLQVGLWTQLGSNISVEIMAGTGFDWLVLDTEHAPNDYIEVYSQLQACDAAGTTTQPLVRVPWNDKVMIKRYLDIGAQSLLIPMVETVEDAKAAVAATRYPPKGVRGYCGAPRASKFGRIKDYPFVFESELCLIVQIETKVALSNIEKIAAIEGIDGLFIGPGDLSADLGFIHDTKNPEVLRVIEDALRRINAAGKPAGILCPDEALAHKYIEMGFNFIAVGSDQGLLKGGADALLAKFR